ncbi:MAG TPA: hypothetical protein VFB42_01985 [Gaiellaceae bacterium]|nr:hypothetical protein [Gaiellaceae bacterium]
MGVRELPRGDAAALLDREIDDLLLQARGLVLVRDLLVRRGATQAEIAAHERELERVRARLADLVRGPGPSAEPVGRAA